MTRLFIGYYRVSTRQQQHGIDAQREAANRYAASIGGKIVAEYKEVESGKKDDRPQLYAAIQACKDQGATLLIGKLDRLSRNVAFLFALKDELYRAGVEVIAADMPEVVSNTLMLSVMAGMAQHEREMISRRTREGLAAARAKGKVLGKPENLTDDARRKGNEAYSALAKQRNAQPRAIANKLRKAGDTLQSIADFLNESGFTTARGKSWGPVQVSRLCA